MEREKTLLSLTCTVPFLLLSLVIIGTKEEGTTTTEIRKKAEKFLGISNSRVFSGNRNSQNQELQKFLSDLHLVHKNSEYFDTDFGLAELGFGSEINTIRTFKYQDLKISSKNMLLELQFNISRNYLEHENLIAAEFRIPCQTFKNVYKENRKNDPKISFVIYEILKRRKNITKIVREAEENEIQDEEKQEVIDRILDKNSPCSFNQEWLVFDVTPAAARWSRPNKKVKLQSLRIRVFTRENKTSRNERQQSYQRNDQQKNQSINIIKGLNNSVVISISNHTNYYLTKSALVAYTFDPQQKSQRRLVRVKRGTRTRNSSRRKRKRKRKERTRREDEVCSRRSMNVVFEKVGWSNWIVAPKGFNAYQCLGACKFPIAETLNTTNHAIIQTLVHSVDSRAVPETKCVPTELSPLSLVYKEDNEKLVAKNYKDMIVEGCGCR